MRIIAGSLKGRKLRAPVPDGIRPTSDGLRETLFNILGSSIEGAQVLDGYAGTGAVGLEAISRGAAAVTFVDRSVHALALIAENVRHCDVERSCAIIRGDFPVWADQRELGETDRFDLVWLDPPYGTATVEGVLRAAANRLRAAGQLIVEHSRRETVPLRVDTLVRARTVVAGDSVLSFFVPVAAAAMPRH